MFERENREDRRRPRSLPAQGRDARAPYASLLSVADEVKPYGDAVERHRLARAQREAQANAAPRNQFDDHDEGARYSETDSFYDDPAYGPEESPGWKNPIEALRSAIKRAVSRKAPDHEATYEEIDQHFYDENYTEENYGGFEDAPVFASDAVMQSAEAPMYHPVYPDPNALYAPQQPAMGFAQPQFQQGAYAQPAYPQAPYYPVPPHMMPQQTAPYPMPQMQPYAPQPYAPPQPYPYAQPPQQQMAYPQQAQAWQMPPPPVYPYAPMPQQFSQQRPPEMQAMPAPVEEAMPIEEIRASLREFRDAVRDLADSRSRRRYF